MPLYGTVPPFLDPDIPIDHIYGHVILLLMIEQSINTAKARYEA